MPCGVTSTRSASILSFGKKVVFASLTFGATLVFAMLAAEMAIQLVGTMSSSMQPQVMELDYVNTWREGGTIGRGGYLKEGFSGDVIDGYGRTVRWVNNKSGFRSEQDFSERPKPGVLRILSLGDSFVAGYRVAQGKTFSDLVEYELEREKVPCEMLISCIEHPQRGLEYLKTNGHKWNPHVVLLGITLGNDISQDYASLNPERTGFEHGLERYELPEYSLCSVEQPLRERALAWLQRCSQLIGRVFPKTEPIVSWYKKEKRRKMLDPCHGLGLYVDPSPEVIREAYRRHLGVLAEYRDFCRERQILLAVLLFPQRFQVQPKDWRATVLHYQLNPASFDLRLPNKVIGRFCETASISVVDPTEHMAESFRHEKLDMYLPRGDMHWNEEGHRQCFKGIWPKLRVFMEPTVAHIHARGQQQDTDMQ